MTARLRLAAVTLTAIALAAAPRAALAHGGEDHGEPAPAAGAAPGSDGRRATYGQTSAFELLVKHAPPAPGQPASLMVFLSDYATNAPIADARIELEIQASPPVKTVAESAGGPGLYHAIATAPAGTFPAIATITAGSALDLVELKALDLSPGADAHAHAAAAERGFRWGTAGALAGGLVVLVLAAVAARRWRARRAPPTVAVLVLVAGFATVARGHGGEDHGEPQPAAASAPAEGVPPGGVFMAKESQFLLGVRTAPTSEREVEARVQAVGRVIPRIDGHAAIAAPVGGRVLAPPSGKLPFIGDKVKKGQPLFVLEQTLGAAESGDLRARALEAKTQVAQARAKRDQARRELERRRSLEGVVSQREIQEAQLELELAERELELAEQQTRLFGGAGLTRVTVTAPIDGTIAAADVSLGEQVPADQQVYTIIDGGTLWVEAEIFEGDVARVEAAGSADLRVEGLAETLPASVYRVGQVIDPTTRTVKVILAVDNAAGRLRPGMFAQVAIGAGGKQRALAIPDAAVIEEGGRRFVFVKLGPELFLRREVVLGGRDGDFWAVRAGVKKGERVVVQGTYQLRTAR
jgi:cobalt-zinc-cadmium efflux system membrane fusion protein